MPAAAPDPPPPFLSAEPPPRAARALAGFLLAMAATTAAFAALFELPDTAQGTFRLVPIEGGEPVRAPLPGALERLAVARGDEVEAGALLCVLRAPELRGASSELAQVEARLAETSRSVAALDSRAALRAALGRARQDELAARREALAREEAAAERLGALAQARADAASAAAAQQAGRDEQDAVALDARRRLGAQVSALSAELEAQGLLSSIGRMGYEDMALTAASAAREGDRRAAASRAAARDAEAAAQAQAAQLELEAAQRAGRRATLEAELARALREQELEVAGLEAERRQLAATTTQDELRARTLRRQLEGAEGDLVAVRAPFAGVVLTVLREQAGGPVERGEPLVELARRGAALEAELELQPKSAGRVQPGQPARLLFEAYPYPRYGPRLAEVRWVSPEAGKDGVLRARAAVAAAQLEVVVEGRRVLVKPGLGGEIRVQTGRRTLLDFMLEPIRQLRTNMTPLPAPEGGR